MMDYSIHTGRGHGPTVDVAPGNAQPDEAEFIHLDEEVFFAIEGFFSSNDEETSQIDRYGESVIRFTEWSVAMERIATEVEARFLAVQSASFELNQIESWHWLARHPQILEDIRLRGMPGLLEFLEMLSQFSNIGSSWSRKYSNVYIFGV